MTIKTVSAGASVFVFAGLFLLAFNDFGQGRATAAAGSAPVTIVNTPVPITGTVAFVPSEPFAAKGTDTTQDELFASDKFVVPAGKRLIVETVTLRASVPAGDTASCGVTAAAAAGSGVVTHYFVMTPQGGDTLPSREIFASTAPVRLYFGPEDSLVWFCFRSNGTGFISLVWSISGYVVDA